MNIGTENILRVNLSRADDIDRKEGKLAYIRYKTVCARLSSAYGYTLPETVAVVAALSPNCDYYKNLRSAMSLLSGHRAGRPVERIRVASYNHCRNRAYEYLNGVSFLETVRGLKIRSFYLNICDPLDPLPVTIDGHARNAHRNDRRPMKDSLIKPKDYLIIADDFRTAADRLGILPNQLQATVWFCWKRTNRILYEPPQNHLFINRAGDYWKTLSIVRDLTEYDELTETEIRKNEKKSLLSPEQNGFQF